MIQLLRDRGAGQVIWAITNVCNAGCNFCSYPSGKGGQPAYVDYETARKVLAILKKRNWRILSLTGGEPLLNPDIYKIITYATAEGFVVRTGTNGWVLSQEVVRKLRSTGLRNFWISIDSEFEDRHDDNRGIPGLISHIKKMIPYLKDAGINVNAAVPINKLVGDYQNLLDFLQGIGLNRVAFCYPMTTMKASYGGAAESHLVDFTSEELVRVLAEIKRLKEEKYRGMGIINPVAGLDNITSWLVKERGLYPCLGGYKFFYLDWNLKLFHCAYRDDDYGNILDLDPGRQFRPRHCDQCMWQCFRDPAVFYYVFDLLGQLKTSLAEGNIKDIRSLLEERRSGGTASAWFGLARDQFYS